MLSPTEQITKLANGQTKPKKKKKNGVNWCKCDTNIYITFMKGAKPVGTNLH